MAMRAPKPFNLSRLRFWSHTCGRISMHMFKIYGKWSVQTNKQTNEQASIHIRVHNAVMLVWGLLRLAPTKLGEAKEVLTHFFYVLCQHIKCMCQTSFALLLWSTVFLSLLQQSMRFIAPSNETQIWRWYDLPLPPSQERAWVRG